MMGFILNALEWLVTSEAGQTIVFSVAGLIGGLFFKKGSRERSILDLAEKHFWLVEAAAKAAGWKSGDKWLRFVERIVDEMLARGMGAPTGKEMQMLRDFATARSGAERKMRQ